MNRENIYEQSLDRNSANFAHLTPLSFLERCASVYPERTSIIHGDTTHTWSQTYARCCLLASALARIGIGKGDTVSFMGANTPETFEAHFGVPMIGAVLNALNTRLDAKAIAFILEHAETKVLFTDREHSATIKAALKIVKHEILVIDIDDPYYEGGELLGEQDYEAFIATGDPEYRCFQIEDEWQAITLNYTSGTTGDPKGVVFHHRGAYLNAVSNVLCWKNDRAPGLSLDLAHVPLQRLVLPLEPGRRRRGKRLPAPRARPGHVRRHQAPPGHPFLRRPRGAQHLDQRPRGTAPGHRPQSQRHDRRRRPARRRHRRHGKHGLRSRPRLRLDRDLRPLRRMRAPGRVGRTRHRRPRRNARPPGRARATARRTHGGGPGKRCGPCPKTAKPWAKSSCAAIS